MSESICEPVDERVCPTCGGSTWIAENVPCPECANFNPCDVIVVDDDEIPF